MMATTSFESQRLISVSLGKIAQSRSQKGGINLHKNLLVATVLHKARTACMMELQRQRQIEFEQRQQQLKDAAALEFEAKQEQARSAALSLAAFNTSPQPVHNMIPTCVREMEEQDQACDAQSPASDPVPHESEVNLGQTNIVVTSPSHVHTQEAEIQNQIQDTCNKENSPPVQCVMGEEDSDLDLQDELDLDFDHQLSAQVVPLSSVLPPTPAADHLAAATQLSEDSAQGLTSHKSQTSAGPTCNVLKRQRENWVNTSQEQECPPATKKARLVASASRRDSRTNYTPESSEVCSVYQNTPCATDCSNQISSLVSIFNSGFTGLCAVSSLSSQASNEDFSSSSSSDNVSGQYAQSDSLSLSSSLSCSSSLGRMDTIPSALGLVLSV